MDIRSDDLQRRQAAASEVEDKMVNFLLQFTPAGDLTLGNAKTIANAARKFAFDAFSAAAEDRKD